MDETTTTPEATITPVAVPAPTKAEALAAEQAAKRAAKAATLAARKAANAEKRANGVIGTLHQMLQTPLGATKREVLAALTERFPDRDPIGMATTVGIQLSRLQKKHGKITSRKQGERGLVYGYLATVQYAPEGSPGVVIPAADLMVEAGKVAGLPVETIEEMPGHFPDEVLDDVQIAANKAIDEAEVAPTPEPIAAPTPAPSKKNRKGRK